MSEELEKSPAEITNKEATENFLESIWEKHKEQEPLQMDRYGFGAWSISKLKVLQKCPLNFYLKYVLKIKVPEDVGGRTETLSADVGSAAHRVLEFVMLGKGQNESFAATKKEFVPSKLTEAQWVEHVESLEMQVSSFKERMDNFNRRNPIKRVFTEMKVGVTKDWEGCAFFDKEAYFRGIIDLCIQLQNGDLVIIDHKTGGGEGSLRPYEAQLNSYKPLFHHGVTPINGAQAGIHFIRAQDVRMAEYHKREDIETKLIKSLEWDMSGAVDWVSELGFFKHVCGNYCRWCDYASVCKSKDKLLKPLELDTKKVIQIKKV